MIFVQTFARTALQGTPVEGAYRRKAFDPGYPRFEFSYLAVIAHSYQCMRWHVSHIVLEVCNSAEPAR